MSIDILELNRVTQEQKGDTLEVPQQNVPLAWGEEYRFDVVGKDANRLEALEKVTGRALYSSDVSLPGQLYAGVLRCPHPHARLVDLDSGSVRAMAGVHAVLTALDDLDISWYGEETPLLERHLRFGGDEVAAVACETPEQVRDALALFKARYDILPFEADMERVLAASSQTVHEGKVLMEEAQHYERGDAETALAEADVRIDETYHTQTALHNALEPHCTVANWEGEELVLYDSTQGLFAVRSGIADKLGMPHNRVRVIKQHMGGGFGAKQVPWKQAMLAALLARQAGRPVGLMLDREAENLAAGNRSATRQRVRLAAKGDGKLTAIGVEVLLTGGAYSTEGEASNVTGLYQHLYACDNVLTEQRRVYTNAGPSVAFRAPGYVEATFALESAMDQLACKLGMDPFELRRRNHSGRDQVKNQPWSSPDALPHCYERLERAVSWPFTPEENPCEHVRRGVGIAAHEWMAGTGSPPAYAYVQINEDGSVDVITGTQDIGTGSRTMLAQVAAEALGIKLDQVRVRLGDTATGPYSPTSAGSFTTPTMAPAVMAAAFNARDQLLNAAAELLQVSPEDLSIRQGQVFRCDQVGPHDDEDSALISIRDLASRLSPHMIQGHGSRHANAEGYSIRTFGAQLAEVEVNTLTGEITVLRVVAAPDCGRILNPGLAYSQVIGGVTQGIGYALSEQRIIDRNLGAVLNANLEDYLVPTVMDVPPIELASGELPDLKANPTGAKGLGELPMIPTAAAIVNAIHDATGLRIRTLPVTRRCILEALAEQQSQRREPA